MYGAKFEVAVRNSGKDVGKQIARAVQALEVLRDLIVGTCSTYLFSSEHLESADRGRLVLRQASRHG